MSVPVNTLHRLLIEQLPGVVYLMRADSEEPLLYLSPQAESLLGLSREECLSNPAALHNRLHPDDRSRVLGERRRVARGGRPGTIEYRFVRPDGRTLWLRDQATDMLDREGVRYVQGIVLDVSEAKRAEEERDRMELELRLSQRLEAVGQLAAGIAHEVNTPIQYIGDTAHFLEEAFTDVMRLLDEHRAAVERHAPPAERARLATAEQLAELSFVEERVPRAFERVFDGIGRVAAIVRAMSGFARPATHERAEADLNRALEETLTIAANSYKHVAEVETDLGDLPPVVCNVGDLNQVFLNLVVNAAHAIEDAVGESPARGILRVTTAVEGGEAVVSVSDTGAGIPAAVASRVFDPFFTTKEVGRGTGQGLSIARAIVDRHDGTLEFAPRPGGGTVFTVRLPLGQASAAATSDVGTAPSRSTLNSASLS